MKTGSIIVLYEPALELTQPLIDTVRRQSDVVCIIDNSRDSQKSHLNLDEGLEGTVLYHHFDANVGIAAAQNTGLKMLQEQHCELAVLFDQDSEIDEQFIAQMKRALKDASSIDPNVVAIGPQIVCSYSDKTLKPLFSKQNAKSDGLVEVEQIIASGMMIQLSSLSQIGLKDETLFIDGVDHEWCWRARQKSFSVCVAENIQMTHRIGESHHRFLWFSYRVGAPIRLYYQFRNFLILVRRDYVPTYWKFRNLALLLPKFLVHGLFENSKTNRVGFMLRGLLDGLRNRVGSYQSNWRSD